MTARPSRRPADVMRWLDEEPSIDELILAFPDEWARIRREAARRGASGDRELRAYMLTALTPRRQGRDRVATQEQRMLTAVRQRMLLELVRQGDLAAESGVESGTVRLNRLNGTVAQQLFFAHDLVRKPVSMTGYRLVWPLLWQRRRLLPLVRRRGIYCFYSRPFVRRLARLTEGRAVLEIAAGDGTLTRFLREQGVDAHATDDYSWSRHVDFDASVERMNAARALRTYQPTVVVCSWPPAGNLFEKAVFAASSVEVYVVIVSRTKANAGAWETYEAQDAFEMRHDPSLSRLVLPSRLNDVLVFRRRTSPLVTNKP